MDDVDSPYAYILHTNYAPSDSEILEIDTYLLEPEAKLQCLEAEITRMRVLLEGLESEQARLKQFVDSHRALFSPIRRMAPEILQEIFVRCVPTFRNYIMDATEPPLLLTRVCSGWRQIALFTPRLWSSLHIHINQRPYKAPTNTNILEVIRKAKDWLTRSGICPLSITLTTDEPHMDNFLPIIELLAPFMHRSQSLAFGLPAEFPVRLGSHDMPILKEISIKINNQPLPEINAFSILNHIPSLSRVTMAGHISLDDALSLPLSQLQELDLRCPYTSYKILNLLGQCNNLREFSLTTQFSPDFDRHVVHRVILPHLHTFFINVFDHTIEVFLQNLTLPSLRVLIAGDTWISEEFNYDDAREDKFYPALADMITRSSCRLETFNFPHMHESSEKLFECFSLMSSLTDLTLASFDPTWRIGPGEHALGDPLLRLLTPTNYSTSTCLLPNLRSIRLFSYVATSDEAILDFAHSSMQFTQPLAGIARLDHVFIQRLTDDEQALSVSPDLLSLRDCGLDFTVDTLHVPVRRWWEGADAEDES